MFIVLYKIYAILHILLLLIQQKNKLAFLYSACNLSILLGLWLNMNMKTSLNRS